MPETVFPKPLDKEVASLNSHIANLIKTVDGTFANTATYTSYINFPTGFNNDNTVILGIMIYAGNEWRVGTGVFGNAGRTFVGKSTNGFRAYNDVSELFGASFKIVITK